MRKKTYNNKKITGSDVYKAPEIKHAANLSLEGMHGSVDIPSSKSGFWQQWKAFVGPALLVSVGYMDPEIGAPICREVLNLSMDFYG